MTALKDADALLQDACATGGIPVHVMPGAEDPANSTLPQQPIHRFLFAACKDSVDFANVTNPHAFDLQHVQ